MKEDEEDEHSSSSSEAAPPPPPPPPPPQMRKDYLAKRSHTSLSVMSNLNSYLNESQRMKLEKYISNWKSFVTMCRDIAKILLNTLLYNSYLGSLVGLFVCGLTQVNLLNAGYCMYLFPPSCQKHLLTDRSDILYLLHHQSTNRTQALGLASTVLAGRLAHAFCVAIKLDPEGRK